MNRFRSLTKEQFYEIFYSFKSKGLIEFVPIFESDIELVIKLMNISPLSYNSLNIKLKKNKEIIEATYKSFIEKNLTGIDFYSVIAGSKDKVKSFEKFFGNSSCSTNILKILILDEYCYEGTTELMDKYEKIVIQDDTLLNDIITICGFVGFLKKLNDDSAFLLRMVKINGYCLLLASERLKSERNLILEAIKSKPMIAFNLELQEDDPFITMAINKIKSEANMYIELPCLYIDAQDNN